VHYSYNSLDANKENVAPQGTTKPINAKVYSANNRLFRFLLADLNSSIKCYLKMIVIIMLYTYDVCNYFAIVIFKVLLTFLSALGFSP
jgi:hypothetical protein